MPQLHCFLLLTLGLSLLACQPTTSSSASPLPTNDDAVPAPTATVELSQADVLYAWVDNLNIRQAPVTNAEVVAKVDAQTVLRFTGQRSENTELIVLRGVAYREPWLKVTTPEGASGWVFGGAVRRADEQKGNAPITETRFNFPYFGQFDLADWERMSREDIAAGDAFGFEATYRQGSRQLEIRRTQTSEYGYRYSYTLREGKEQHLVKRRTLHFDAMDSHIITETVDDFLAEPPVQYERSQVIGQHFMQLNAHPEMARGEWTTANLFLDANQQYRPEKLSVGTFDASKCTGVTTSDTGCGCDFSFQDEVDQATVFYSDLGTHACVQIGGELTALKESDYDYAAEIRRKVGTQAWVTLTQTGDVKVLGDYVDGDWKDVLNDALMVADQLPTEIAVKNEHTGMAIREVRDTVADIFSTVKEKRASGLELPSKWRYEGGGYRVWVKVKNVTSYGGEADTYEGFLEVERDPYVPLFRKAIRGTCGC